MHACNGRWWVADTLHAARHAAKGLQQCVAAEARGSCRLSWAAASKAPAKPTCGGCSAGEATRRLLAALRLRQPSSSPSQPGPVSSRTSARSAVQPPWGSVLCFCQLTHCWAAAWCRLAVE